MNAKGIVEQSQEIRTPKKKIPPEKITRALLACVEQTVKVYTAASFRLAKIEVKESHEGILYNENYSSQWVQQRQPCVGHNNNAIASQRQQTNLHGSSSMERIKRNGKKLESCKQEKGKAGWERQTRVTFYNRRRRVVSYFARIGYHQISEHSHTRAWAKVFLLRWRSFSERRRRRKKIDDDKEEERDDSPLYLTEARLIRYVA